MALSATWSDRRTDLHDFRSVLFGGGCARFQLLLCGGVQHHKRHGQFSTVLVWDTDDADTVHEIVREDVRLELRGCD